jgi:threonine/homoserine/homoserine lactone efflux protein
MEVMMSEQILFMAVLALSVASAVAAAAIAVAVDTRRRPAASKVIERLMQIALLGAGAIVSLLGAAP